METEMKDKQPIMHLFYKYVIRPNAFDRDPFILPKAAQVNKHFYTYGNQKPNSQTPVVKRAEHNEEKHEIDDFETVEAPKKKVKP